MTMKKDTDHLKETLVKLLQNEVASARALFQSLKSESAALSSMDEKLVTINSAKKQRLIKSLQQASDSRIVFMDEHGLSSRPAVIKEYTISSDSNTELDTLFIQLSEIAQQCFTENRIIGQLINRRTQFITQTLSSLSPSAHLQELTYAENGSTATSNNSLFHLTKI